MVAQSIVLINPLLSSSFMYPTIADKLFVQKLPRLILKIIIVKKFSSICFFFPLTNF